MYFFKKYFFQVSSHKFVKNDNESADIFKYIQIFCLSLVLTDKNFPPH